MHKDQKTTHILLLNYVNLPNPVLKEHRGKEGFGSTEIVAWFGSTEIVAWTQEITKERPSKVIKVNERPIEGLFNTETDRSYITGQDWSSAWPVTRTSSTLLGWGKADNVVKRHKKIKMGM